MYTVKQLIELLQQQDPEAVVFTYVGAGEECDIMGKGVVPGEEFMRWSEKYQQKVPKWHCSGGIPSELYPKATEKDKYIIIG